MLWIILAIVWLVCGFVGAGFDRAIFDSYAKLGVRVGPNYKIWAILTIPFFGPLSLIDNFLSNRFRQGWKNPFRF